MTYIIQLTVTNWYKASAPTVFNVYISNKATPIVSLDGISEYSSTNLNLDGLVSISAAITFDDACLNEESNNNNLEYDIIWSVKQRKMDQNDTTEIDTKLFAKLTDFVQTENNQQICIDVQLLLQNGMIYEFIMNMKCKGEYECNINAIHDITSIYGDIQCKMSGNDISLHNMDPNNDDLNFKIKLDAETFIIG